MSSMIINLHEVKEAKKGVSKQSGKEYSAQDTVATDENGKKLSVSFLNTDGSAFNGKQVKVENISERDGKFGKQYTIMSSAKIEVIGEAPAAPEKKKMAWGSNPNWASQRTPCSLLEAQKITDFVLAKYKDTYSDQQASSDFCSKLIATYLASGVRPDMTDLSTMTTADYSSKTPVQAKKDRLKEIMAMGEDN